ncbi:hypothetical protein ABGB12_28415 [Actinocorallia sp. B10E7]|uniref:hypothetical protein n=1 Tax=Actinocorallia sp. B10E7 TaxID=3153558 RepID=UPI00325DC0A2
MVGIPEDSRDEVATAEALVSWADPDYLAGRHPLVMLKDNQILLHKVAMFYSSGNWDADVFTDPYSFDLSRTPNPHVGFGGGGAHFRLGSQVAKAQLRAIFRELPHQIPEIEAGTPEYLAGNFVHAVRAMPCRF